jgi:hypothetical protein
VVINIQLQEWLPRLVAACRLCYRLQCNRFNGHTVSFGKCVHNKGNIFLPEMMHPLYVLCMMID